MLRAAIFACYAVATVALAVLLLVGLALTKLYQRLGWPEEPLEGNCWSFAVPKFLRDPRRTYLVINLSAHAPVPHVRFAPSIEGLYVEEVKPLRPRRGLGGVLDSFWFDARVRKGEGEENRSG